MTATLIEIRQIVIGGLADRIPPVNPDTNPAGFGEYTEQLCKDISSRGFSVAALEAGMAFFRHQHEARSWPTTAKLIGQNGYLEQGRKSVKTDFLPAPSAVKPKGWEWEKYVMAKYGDTAREKGIAYDLLVWAERNPGIEPTGDLFAELVGAVERVDAKIGDIVANPSQYALAAPLIALGKAMQEKRARFNEGVSYE